MSCSTVIERSNESPNDTLVIFVYKDGTCRVDPETLKTVLKNQARTNVSIINVSQSSQPASDSKNTGPRKGDGHFAVKGWFPKEKKVHSRMKTSSGESKVRNEVENILHRLQISPDNIEPFLQAMQDESIENPFLEMDPEQIKRLETVLHSDKAKEIFGDEVVNPLLEVVASRTAGLSDKASTTMYSVTDEHCYATIKDPPPANEGFNNSHASTGDNDLSINDGQVYKNGDDQDKASPDGSKKVRRRQYNKKSKQLQMEQVVEQSSSSSEELLRLLGDDDAENSVTQKALTTPKNIGQNKISIQSSKPNKALSFVAPENDVSNTSSDLGSSSSSSSSSTSLNSDEKRREKCTDKATSSSGDSQSSFGESANNSQSHARDGSTSSQKSTSSKNGAGASKKKSSKQNKSTSKDEEDKPQGDADDPDRLWCLCNKPHNNRFMICCDTCNNWFHGYCVGVSKAMGDRLEKEQAEWACPPCKKEERERDSQKRRSTNRNASRSRDETNAPPNKLQTPPSQQNSNEGSSSSPENSKTPSAVSVTKKPISDSSGSESPAIEYSKQRRSKQDESAGKTQTGKNASAKTAIAKTAAKVSLNSTKKQENAISSPCLVCKEMMESSETGLYCSPVCLDKHVKESLDRILKNMNKQCLQPTEKIIVCDKKTGNLIAGPNAPSVYTVREWLQHHPSFEIVTPAAASTSRFYNELMPQKPVKTVHKQITLPNFFANKKTGANDNSEAIADSTNSPQPAKRAVRNILSIDDVSSPKSKPSNVEQRIKPKPKRSFESELFAANESLLDRKSEKKKSQTHNTVNSLAKNDRKQSSVVNKINATGSPGSMSSSQSQSESIPKSRKSTETHHKSDLKKMERDPATHHKSEAKKLDRDGALSKPVAAPKRAPSPKPVPPPVQEKPAPAKDDPIRKNVRKSLQELFLSRMNDIAHIVQVNEEMLQRLSVEIEEELFALFRDTGAKYKAKYRSLNFNIKDKKNRLFQKIAERSLRPYDLVRLSPEEMASSELAEWREKEQKHELEMIRKTELEAIALAKTVVMKTHKGEEEIAPSSVDITVPDLEDEVGFLIERDSSAKKHKSSSHRHKKDYYRKSSKHSSSHKRDRRDRHKSSRKDISRYDSSHSSKSLQDLFKDDATSQRSLDEVKNILESYEAEKEAQNLSTQNLSAQNLSTQSLPTQQISVSHDASSYYDPMHATDDDIIDDENRTPSPPPKEITPPPAPRPIELPPLWKGDVSLPEAGTFKATIKAVSGSCECLRDNLASVKMLEGRGRIIPKEVWEYVARSKKSGTKDILVVKFETETTSDQVGYMSFYSYLTSRNRFVVFGNFKPDIKDFYIFPLANTSPVPQVLLPLDGPGFDDDRPHLLIGIAIKFKHKRSLSGENILDSPGIAKKLRAHDSEHISFTPPHSPTSVRVNSLSYIASINKPYDPAEDPYDLETNTADLTEIELRVMKLDREIQMKKLEMEKEVMRKKALVGSDTAVTDNLMEDEAYSPSSALDDSLSIKLPKDLQKMLDSLKKSADDSSKRSKVAEPSILLPETTFSPGKEASNEGNIQKANGLPKHFTKLDNVEVCPSAEESKKVEEKVTVHRDPRQRRDPRLAETSKVEPSPARTEVQQNGGDKTTAGGLLLPQYHMPPPMPYGMQPYGYVPTMVPTAIPGVPFPGMFSVPPPPIIAPYDLASMPPSADLTEKNRRKAVEIKKKGKKKKKRKSLGAVNTSMMSPTRSHYGKERASPDYTLGEVKTVATKLSSSSRSRSRTPSRTRSHTGSQSPSRSRSRSDSKRKSRSRSSSRRRSRSPSKRRHNYHGHHRYGSSYHGRHHSSDYRSRTHHRKDAGGSKGHPSRRYDNRSGEWRVE